MAELLAQMTCSLLRSFAALGLDIQNISRFAQLPGEGTLDPERRTSFDLHMALWDQALRCSGERNLGLRAAPHLAEDYERLARGYCRVGEPICAVLPVFAQALRVLSAASQMELRTEPRGLRVVYGLNRPPWIVPRHHGEAMIGALSLILRRLTQKLRLLEVTFQHVLPGADKEHELFFNCPVLFGAPENGMLIDRESLSLPVVAPEDVAAPTSTLDGPLRDDLMATLRRDITANLSSGDIAPSAIARRLRLSPQQLRAELASRHTTLADVVTSVRRELARAYLHDLSWSFPDITLMLGFPSVPAFRRAFQRWTGQTPGEYRRSLLG